MGKGLIPADPATWEGVMSRHRPGYKRWFNTMVTLFGDRAQILA
jgi:hypothetical protein